jgi:hypothetical protein
VQLPPIRRSRVAITLALAGVLVLCLRGGLRVDDLLCLAPALLLALALLARRYPGERLLATLAGRERRRRVRPGPIRSSSRSAEIHVPRGALLMAFALAVRPPPATPAAS